MKLSMKHLNDIINSLEDGMILKKHLIKLYDECNDTYHKGSFTINIDREDNNNINMPSEIFNMVNELKDKFSKLEDRIDDIDDMVNNIDDEYVSKDVFDMSVKLSNKLINNVGFLEKRLESITMINRQNKERLENSIERAFKKIDALEKLNNKMARAYVTRDVLKIMMKKIYQEGL